MVRFNFQGFRKNAPIFLRHVSYPVFDVVIVVQFGLWLSDLGINDED